MKWKASSNRCLNDLSAVVYTFSPHRPQKFSETGAEQFLQIFIIAEFLKIEGIRQLSRFSVESVKGYGIFLVSGMEFGTNVHLC